MKLIIAEKKLTAEAIAKAIFSKYEYRNKNFIDSSGNNEIIISHCSGHLIYLKEPHEYDESLKKWDISKLPFIFRHPQYNIVPHHKDLFNNIIKLLSKAEVVYHAGDPDDEGQLIVDEILNFAGYKGLVKRIIFSDNNPVIVKKAFDNAEPNYNFVHEGYKALGRSLCDWHYGLNLTRAFTCLHERKGTGLGLITLGRVQDAIKGLVVRRCREIANFTPKEYFQISSFSNININDDVNILKPKLINSESIDPQYLDSENRIISLSAANEIVDYIKHYPYLKVVKSSEILKKKSPPLPYNLLKLQIDMNRKYGLSLDETLSITQSLRDNYNAITYNRSDCQYLSDETFLDSERILNTINQNASIFSKKITKTNTSIKSKCFNTKKVSAHHAIIPTFDKFNLSKLTENEKKCYFLIARSFIAQFYEDKEYKVKTIILTSENNKYSFTLSARYVLNEGWEELYRNDLDNSEVSEDKEIPEIKLQLSDGDTIFVNEIKIEDKKTQPAKYYTEDSLALELTRVAKYINNPELKKIMIDKDAGLEGEHGGIGTPATRGEILKNLFEKGFFIYDGKKILATEKCHTLYDMLPDPVRYPDLTALWQAQMKDIKNRENVNAFLDHVMKQVTILVEQTRQQFNSIEVIEYDCPSCKENNKIGKLKRRNGQFGIFWGCDNYQNGCKYNCTDLDNKPTFKKEPFNHKKKWGKGSKKKGF